jgi:periplasmic protein TonB
MRRRKQKNPLLMRIFVISILAHILILPILAHFGAFKKIQQHFVEIQAVRLPPPPAPEKPKQEAKKQPKAPEKVAQKAKRGPTTSHTRQAAQKSNFTQPKVVASGGAGGTGEGGPTVNNDLANGKAGQLPTVATTTAAPTVKAPEPAPKQPEAPKTPEAPKEIARVEKPVMKAPEVKAPEPKAPEPKAPVFTEAAPAIPTDQEPKPAIPDDLRADALDKMCVVRFTISPDGKPTRVEIAQSSGSDELDRAALDAARQWKFTPATRDGAPVESQVNLHIEFQVS